MKDLITIIVPVYNVEKYLEECLICLINQTYKNIEILLINDGSTDESLNIMNRYKEIDTRIVIINRENKGVLYTRVEGYKEANGKYITFVDSDDWIELNTIETLYKNIVKYNADVVKANISYNDSKEPIRKFFAAEKIKFIDKKNFEPEFYDMLFKNVTINSLCAQMFKKDILSDSINNIDTSITLGDDLEFNIQLYKNIKNILFMEDVLYHYRNNPSSITRKLSERNIKNSIISATKCYYNLYKNLKNFEIRNELEYKKSILARLLDEACKWQIDLIGTLNNKKQCIEYMKWYFYEYEYMKEIKLEIEKIKLDVNKLKYKTFYKKIYTNLEKAYIVGICTYKIKQVYRNIKNKIKKYA